MGTIKRGILGGFSGKVGTVVGGNWKGIDYMRARATNIKDAKSASQMAQRARFKAVIEFLQTVISVVQVGFTSKAVHQSAFNAAMAYNLKNAVTGTGVNATVDYQNVMLTQGPLQLPVDVELSVSRDDVIVTWDTNSEANGQDRAFLVVYNKVKKIAFLPKSSAVREDGEFGCTVYPSWSGDPVEVYLYFKSADDDKVISNSMYAGTVTPVAG